MGLRINTNVQSMTAQHRLSESREVLEQTQNRLSTGSRIVRPMDDAAGLAISENIRATQRSTAQNIKNAQNGFQLLQTADGALGQVTNIIVRMKELAVQAASDTNGDRERMYLNDEYQALKSEMDRIARTTLFNGRPLLTGEGGEIAVQVGPNNVEEDDRILISSNFNVQSEELGVAGWDILSTDSARETLEPTTDVLDRIAKLRGEIGAGESRLNSTMQSLAQYEENLSAAFSQIRDADWAFETAQLAKYGILTQAGVAVLSQANNSPSLALKLLG